MRRSLVPIAAVALVLALAGCGGGDDGADGDEIASSGVTGFTGPAPDDPISYHLAADRYCRQAEHELDQRARETFGNQPPSEDELESFVSDVYVPVMTRNLEQLRSIPIPAGEEDEVNAIYDALEQGIQEAEDDPGAFTGQEPPEGIAEASRLAVEYGFDDCGTET